MRKTNKQKAKVEATPNGSSVERMLPIGTLILDKATESGGIVVGAFRGANHVVHVYVRPDGEVDMAYWSQIEIAEGNRGGLPAVTDLNGNDPLASMQVVVERPMTFAEQCKFRLLMALGGPADTESSWETLIKRAGELYRRDRERQHASRPYSGGRNKGVRLVVGMDGKPITGEQLARRMPASRRRTRAAAAA